MIFFSIPNGAFTVCRDAAGIAGNIFAFRLFVSRMIVIEAICLSILDNKSKLSHLFIIVQAVLQFDVFGNIFAFGLFVSPLPTFRRIMRNQSTEQFSGLPYLYALVNCLICTWYGTPLISYDNFLVMTVNSIGAVFQIAYIVLFIVYADKEKKMRMLGLLLAVFALLAIIVAGSLQIIDREVRRIVVGLLSCASLISMFASPLLIINLVIRTKSVEFMPFYLSLSTFLMSTSFFLYGIFNFDAFIYVPNGIGTILGILQLALYFHYKRRSSEESREPLVVSHT